MIDVWYTCPFVPPEWIAAHGARPRYLRPGRVTDPSGRQVATAGVCTYARAFVAAAAQLPPGDALVMTTLCDQMRRGCELLAAERGEDVFLMNVPATWQSPAARRLYADELRRLGDFLVARGGDAPSKADLADVLRRYDESRRGRAPAPATGRPGVALVGAPVMRDDFWLFDRIAAAGADVVLDATVGSELTLPAPLDRRELADDPFDELVRIYFDHIPHPARRPNSGFYQYLRDQLRQRDIRGILYVRYVWCDIWHAELRRLKDFSPVVVVDLDLSDDARAAVRAATRVEALIETLR